MVRVATPILALTIMLAAIGGPLYAQSASLQQCQQWKNQIDYYSKLRKGGGSAPQMESWKQQRREYEERFRDADCRKYGRQLK